MSNIIHYDKAIAHGRLSERHRDLRDTVAALEQPDQPVGPFLRFTATTLLTDIYRLVSREPGARALPRIAARDCPTGHALRVMLREAGLALDAFAWNHRDHDGDIDEEWLTWEGIHAFHESRQKKLSPSSADH